MSIYHRPAKRNLGAEAKHIEIKDLPSEMKDLARLIGLEPALKVIAHYSGETIYVPKYTNMLLGLRNRLIQKEFDGRNLRALAAKYNLSTKHIRNIISKK